MVKLRFNIVTVIVLGLLIAACSSGVPPENAVATRTVTDDLGRSVSVPVKIERAISLAPSLTEMIFAVGAGDKLVGVTTFCNYPEETKAIQKVGDTMTPNIESIIALKPQIVFVSTASQLEAFMATLGQQNIAVFVTDPKNLDGVFSDLTKLGELLGSQVQTLTLVNDLRRRVDAVKGKERYESRLRVFVQVSRDPLFTIGRDSFLTELLVTAGGRSATSDVPTAYPKLSLESAVALDPDVIILSDSEDNREPSSAFKDSKAVRSGRVHRIDADLLSRPGPRLVEALEKIEPLLNVHRS